MEEERTEIDNGNCDIEMFESGEIRVNEGMELEDEYRGFWKIKIWYGWSGFWHEKLEVIVNKYSNWDVMLKIEIVKI